MRWFPGGRLRVWSTQWSWRLSAVFPEEEIGPGSAASANYNHRSKVWSEGARYRVVYSHDDLGTFASLPWIHHETTMLRSAQDMMVHGSVRWLRYRLARILCGTWGVHPDDEPAVRRLWNNVNHPSTPWKAGSPDKPVAPECEKLKTSKVHVSRPVSQINWLLHNPSAKKLGADGGRGALQRAGMVLARMPFFGLQHRWVESACLWHFLSARPWPGEHPSKCPSPPKCLASARVDEEERTRTPARRALLRAYGTAPYRTQGRNRKRHSNAVCPADVAAQVTGLRGGPTRCLLLSLCSLTAANATLYKFLLGPLVWRTTANVATDFGLLDVATVLFDERMAAVAPAARRRWAAPRSSDPSLHEVCFRRPPPHGFAEVGAEAP